MIVDIIHHNSTNESIGKCDKAHLYTPDNLPFDIDECSTLSNFAILVLVPFPPNVTVAVPYSTYKTSNGAYEHLKFTGSFAFSVDRNFSMKASKDFYRPIPIMER